MMIMMGYISMETIVFAVVQLLITAVGFGGVLWKIKEHGANEVREQMSIQLKITELKAEIEKVRSDNELAHEKIMAEVRVLQSEIKKI